MKVVWNIRWNLPWGIKSDSKAERAPERKTKEWEDYRVSLYERFCQPGLVAQTYKDFEVWLKCDPKLKRLTEIGSNSLGRRLADKRFSIVYIDELNDVVKKKAAIWKQQGYDMVLVCRVDSDDGLHRNATLEMVRATSSMGDKTHVQLDQGLVYDLKTKALREWNNPSPPFIGRPVPTSELESGILPGCHHVRIRPFCKTIRGEWYYLVVCHNENVCNTINAPWAGRVFTGSKKSEMLKLFGIVG